MKIVNITEDDIVDSITGINVTVWFAGCDIQCSGCHNKELWDPSKFPDSSREEILEKVIKAMSKPPKQRGLSILGGEPFEDQNRPEVLKLIKKVKEVYPQKDIWMYSGYLFEEIQNKEYGQEILSEIDILVDGEFVKERKNLKLKFRGSDNQRIIDVKKTLKTGQIVLAEKYIT
jgi:anaerobic ribonucleoside-triphosphate reductase activating protein